MIDDPDRHIPDNIRDAFADAVPLLIHWDRGGPEPFVSLGGESALISTVFRFAECFEADPMPESVWMMLLDYADRSLSREVEGIKLGADRSYAIGSRCLLQWVNDNKARYGV